MITEFWASLENSGLGVWTRESSSVWAYPTILTLHTIGLGVVVGASTVIDLRLLGFSKKIPIRSLSPLFRAIWWAFAINFVTGVLLFMADATHKAGQRVFHVKLILIAIALLCTLRVQKSLKPVADLSELTDVPASLKRLAIISMLLWTGAIAAGRLMAYL